MTTESAAQGCAPVREDSSPSSGPAAADLLRDLYDFTRYVAAAFVYDDKGSGSLEWFAGLRDQIESLQPRAQVALDQIPSYDESAIRAREEQPLYAEIDRLRAELAAERKAREEAELNYRTSWEIYVETKQRAEAAEARLATTERETVERCARIADSEQGDCELERQAFFCRSIASKIRVLLPKGEK